MGSSDGAVETEEKGRKLLLAVVRPNDKGSKDKPAEYLDFISSLPEGSEDLVGSLCKTDLHGGTAYSISRTALDGHTGKLEDHISDENKVLANRRSFLIFSVPSLEGINRDYFAEREGTALYEIPNKFTLKIRYKKRKNRFSKKHHTFDLYIKDGSFGFIMEGYEKMVKNPKNFQVSLLEHFTTSISLQNTIKNLKAVNRAITTERGKIIQDTDVLMGVEVRVNDMSVFWTNYMLRSDVLISFSRGKKYDCLL